MKIAEILEKEETSKVTRSEAETIMKEYSPILTKNSWHWELAGSYRRGKAEIGDLDFIVVNTNLAKLLEELQHTSFPIVRIWRKGEKVASFIIKFGDKLVQIELSYTKPESLGAELLHSTGSGPFNVGIRSYCKNKGWILNQHGLFDVKTNTLLAGKTEEEIFHKLGMNVVPPVERDNFWISRKKYKIKTEDKLES